jgi:hypothetical protein
LIDVDLTAIEVDVDPTQATKLAGAQPAKDGHQHQGAPYAVLLWASLQAQKDPMVVTNARFLAGWSALVQVLGAPRMTAIATALGVTIV